MREWLVFDVMGVIFTVGDDTNELLVPYVQKFAPSLTSDEINQAYLEASLGKVASYGFWKTLGLGDRYPNTSRKLSLAAMSGCVSRIGLFTSCCCGGCSAGRRTASLLMIVRKILFRLCGRV